MKTITPLIFRADLVEYWDFQNLTSATDGTQIPGINGTVATVRGYNAVAGLSVDGITLPGGAQSTEAYLQLPAGVISQHSDFTAHFWVTLHSRQSWQRIFDFGSGTNNYLMLAPNRSTNPNENRFEVRLPSSSETSDTAITITLDQKYLYTLVWDDLGNGTSKASWYLDGTLINRSLSIDAAGLTHGLTINTATTSTRTIDQRGFAITDGSPDIGAAEFQGSSDFAPLWDIDHDGDGSSFGVEFALGTDPFVSDPGHLNNFMLSFDGTDSAVIQFGYNSEAISYAIWIIERSDDLEGWTEVFRSDDPNDGADSSAAGINEEILPDTAVILTDVQSASDPRNFYRFVAERVE